MAKSKSMKSKPVSKSLSIAKAAMARDFLAATKAEPGKKAATNKTNEMNTAAKKVDASFLATASKNPPKAKPPATSSVKNKKPALAGGASSSKKRPAVVEQPEDNESDLEEEEFSDLEEEDLSTLDEEEMSDLDMLSEEEEEEEEEAAQSRNTTAAKADTKDATSSSKTAKGKDSAEAPKVATATDSTTKQSLFEDSDEEEEEEDSDDLMDIEKEQENIDKETAATKKAAAAYQKEVVEKNQQDLDLAENSEDKDLLEAAALDKGSEDEGEDGEEEGDAADKKAVPKAMEMSKLKAKMEKNIELLNDWKTLGRASARTRQEVRDEVCELVTMYYGYNPELAKYFLDMFPPEEALSFFEANEKARPVTLRTNTLKTRKTDLAKQLTARGVNVANIGEWCNREGLKVLDSSVPVGATPEYLAGHYMIQAASSFVPVLALNPQEGESILDMAAAPGGKCTHVGQLMKNTGTLYVNELQKQRLSSLTGNIHRLGLTNTVVLNYDGRELRDVLPPHSLDRVLLDAPCSGAGIVARDPTIKSKRNLLEFEQTAQLQKQLLLTAIDLCDAKKNGTIVYSTCSVSVEENEMVVDAILKKRNVRLVDFRKEIPFGVPGFTSYREHRFDKTVEKTQRFYPHRHNMDGFFVAKFEKFSNDLPNLTKRERKANPVVHWGKDKWEQMAETLVEYGEEQEEVDDENAATGAAEEKDEINSGSDKEQDGEKRSNGDESASKKSKSKVKGKISSSTAAGSGLVDHGANAALAEKMRLFRSGDKAKLKKMVAKEKKGEGKKGSLGKKKVHKK